MDRIRALGGPDTADVGDAGQPLDPDAVAYVVLGSQLGMTVLRRHLTPEECTGIFQNEPDIAAWKRLATRLSSLPADTDTARRTIADAHRAFEMFHAAAVEILTPHTEKTL